mgnify:CR=1 FL=1
MLRNARIHKCPRLAPCLRASVTSVFHLAVTSTIRAALVLITLLHLSACIDHWGPLEPDWQAQLDKEAQRARDVTVDRPSTVTPMVAPVTLPDGSIALSVEQAALIALQNNRDLAVQQLNPVITGTFEDIERSRFDVELYAQGEYFREKTQEVSRSTIDRFNVTGDAATAAAGVRTDLPTGTTIDASVQQDRTISNRSPEQQEARVGLSITQSLLQGFGPSVNLAAIRQSQLDTLASRYELRGFTEELLAQMEIAYWNYILAQEEIAIFERSLEVARTQRDEVEERINVGVLPQTEAAAARTEVAVREQALINARSRLEQQRIRLLRLINPTPAGDLRTPVTTTTDPRHDTGAITDIADRLALAMQLRSDLSEARLRLEQNRLQTIVTRNGLLPRLDLFINLGKTGYAGTTIEDSFRDLDGETYDFTAGVAFSHLLGNRAAEARHLAARAARQQSAAAVANLEQLARVDVLVAISEAERTRQQIAASALTAELQQQTVDAERERFQVGASTALLVAQAQRDLLQAQINEVDAIINHRIALVNLYLAEGSLLERRGIVTQTPARP